MRLYQYIPTEKLLGFLGLIEKPKQESFDKAIMSVTPSPITGTGIETFEFQYMPEKLSFSGSAKYVYHKAKGVTPIPEYIYSELEKLPLDFILVDDVHSQFDDSRKLPFGDTLYDAINFFKELNKPMLSTNRPPVVGLHWGQLSFEGVVLDYQIEILKSYQNLDPKIVRVRLKLEGEFE